MKLDTELLRKLDARLICHHDGKKTFGTMCSKKKNMTVTRRFELSRLDLPFLLFERQPGTDQKFGARKRRSCTPCSGHGPRTPPRSTGPYQQHSAPESCLHTPKAPANGKGRSGAHSQRPVRGPHTSRARANKADWTPCWGPVPIPSQRRSRCSPAPEKSSSEIK
jgi:hypothetical protein